MTTPIFHAAFTRDYLNEQGELAYGDIGLALLDESALIDYRFLEAYEDTVTPEQIAGVDGLSLIYPHITVETFAEGADTLTIIARCGAGYDRVNIDACTKADVVVVNAPDALRFPTASATIMYILVLSKRLLMMEDIVRTGRWELRGAVRGFEPRGRTLGIVGFGSIGQEVARLVQPFEMNVLAHDPYVDPAITESLGVELTSLERVLKEADFVSLHCLLTDQTRGLIGAGELALMKPTAYLINMARGPVVDHDALIEALTNSQIAGAGLDVFYEEPLPADDPLIQMDNVVLTPHWAAGTLDVFSDAGTSNIRDMLSISRGQLPRYIVNPEVIEQSGFKRKLARFQA